MPYDLILLQADDNDIRGSSYELGQWDFGACAVAA
jgi:hypothetical protein